MKKITIIGCCGSGKSTLSYKVAELLQLPLYHLDKYYWKPNWQRPDKEVFKKVHDDLCTQEEWVIDGMAMSYLDTRLESADIIIFLDIPRYKCLWRVIKRMAMSYGKTRADMPDGCKERLHWGFFVFLKYVWNFKNSFRPRILEKLKLYQSTKRVIILKSNPAHVDFLKQK